MQMNAMAPILQMLAGLAGRGVSQRQTVAQPSDLTSIVGTVAPLASTLLGPGGALTGLGGGRPNLDVMNGDITRSMQRGLAGIDWNSLFSGASQ